MGIVYGLDALTDRHEKYEVIKDDIVENVDVCVIGSGAAGAVLAKELVEAGKSVVLIERGGYHEGKDMNQREVDMMPLLWKNAGFNFVDSLRIAIAQGCCLILPCVYVSNGVNLVLILLTMNGHTIYKE